MESHTVGSHRCVEFETFSLTESRVVLSGKKEEGGNKERSHGEQTLSHTRETLRFKDLIMALLL